LSPKGRILLKEASLGNGYIVMARTMGGTRLETNGKQLIESSERREIAAWEAIVEELLNKAFINDPHNKGEVFTVTDLGYRVADLIEDSE
jgi:hypothetical protein